MSKKRIDLIQFEKIKDRPWVIHYELLFPDMIAELKRMYAREDELLDALRIIRDDLDDQPTGPNADLFEHINKIRNFANDASE